MFWLQEHHIGIFDYINARFYYLSFCLFLVSCIASVLAAHHEDGKESLESAVTVPPKKRDGAKAPHLRHRRIYSSEATEESADRTETSD